MFISDYLKLDEEEVIHMDLDVNIKNVLVTLNDELTEFHKYFKREPYKWQFFMDSVCITDCNIEKIDFEKIPTEKGIYVFSLIDSLSPEECSKFNESIGTKIRKQYMDKGLDSGDIFYIGSCKAMTLQARISEHVKKAGKGVSSLRLFDEKRITVASRLKIDCFVIRNINDIEEVPKLVLPLMEEKLQQELKPVCGRYRG